MTISCYWIWSLKMKINYCFAKFRIWKPIGHRFRFFISQYEGFFCKRNKRVESNEWIFWKLVNRNMYFCWYQWERKNRKVYWMGKSPFRSLLSPKRRTFIALACLLWHSSKQMQRIFWATHFKQKIKRVPLVNYQKNKNNP